MRLTIVKNKEGAFLHSFTYKERRNDSKIIWISTFICIFAIENSGLACR